MKYLLEKDKRKRNLFASKERSGRILRALSKDKRLTVFQRLFSKMLLWRFRKNFSKSRVKNRCVFTGRARGISRFFRMSRLQVRSLGLRGLLYGIRRSSW